MVTISVIIPAYNEEEQIENVLERVRSKALGTHEYIVAVSGTDATAQRARRAGATVVKGGPRAVALNAGARASTDEIVYFLHADTIPPHGWDKLISRAYEKGNCSGSFRLKFDTSYLLLNCFAWFTRFSWSVARFGDQSLYVSKEIFQYIGGFDERLLIMEDNDIVRRLKKVSTFKIIPKQVVTSARKYKKYGLYRLQLSYVLVTLLYYCFVPQDKLIAVYKKLLSY